jgi:hypothetical protein
MVLLIPILAVFIVALGVSVVMSRVHDRSVPGSPVAVATCVLLDRRVQRLLACGALVVLVIALAVG